MNDYEKKFAQANKMIKEAEQKFNSATEDYKHYKINTQEKIDSLIKKRERIQSKTMVNFAKAFSRFKTVELTMVDIKESRLYHPSISTNVTHIDRIDMKAISKIEDSAINKYFGISMAGTAAAFAVGSAILVPLAPIVAITYLFFHQRKMNQQAEEALTKAKSYAAEVEIEIAKIDAAKSILSGIRMRIEEISSVLSRLNRRLKWMTLKIRCISANPMVANTRKYCIIAGLVAIAMLAYFRIWELIFLPIIIAIILHKIAERAFKEMDITDRDKQNLYIAVQYAWAMRKLLEVTIDDNGEFNKESEKIMQEITTFAK